MSVTGLIVMRGSVMNVRRGTRTQSANLSYDTAYTTVGVINAELSVVTRKEAERLWGIDTKATIKAMIPIGTDVLEGDGLQVTKGLFAGRNLRVLGVLEFKDSQGADHIEAPCEWATTESFN